MIIKVDLTIYKNDDKIPCECEYCHKEFTPRKKHILYNQKHNIKGYDFCSLKCRDLRAGKRINCKCLYCDRNITKSLSQTLKNKHVFCDSSCSAKYYNKKRKESGWVLSDKSRLKIGNTLRLKYASGELKITDKQKERLREFVRKSQSSLEFKKNQSKKMKEWWEKNPEAKLKLSIQRRGQKLAEETKKKISEIHKNYYAIGKTKGWVKRGKPSYAEKFWMDVLNNNNVKYEFEKKVGKYFIDFALNDKMIALEIDGSQHLREERKLKDVEKDKYLRDQGWTVYRIQWKGVNGLVKQNTTKKQIDEFLKYLG